MKHHHRSYNRHRPNWWPEDENWPPIPQHGHLMRQNFSRRMGCGFLLGVLGLTAIIILVIGGIARATGYLQIPRPAKNFGPFIIPIILFGLTSLFIAGYRFRRASQPFGDLLDTANRVANGDYTARVKIQGDPEIRSLAHAFNDMVSKVEASNAQRQNLMADVTHELRTPLSIIQGNIEGMLDGVYQADEARLNSILEETNILSRLIEDLRILSLVESGALKLNKEPTDLAVLIGETVAAFRAEADTANISISINAPADSPLLEVDSLRIRQALANLLSNAIHHTQQGGQIQVILVIASKIEDALPVQITVQDTGCGISQKDLPHIFDRFYKTSDSGGMGLGLAITKNLIEAHGGTIEAESEEGNGTIMRVSLPS